MKQKSTWFNKIASKEANIWITTVVVLFLVVFTTVILIKTLSHNPVLFFLTPLMEIVFTKGARATNQYLFYTPKSFKPRKPKTGQRGFIDFLFWASYYRDRNMVNYKGNICKMN